MGKLNLLLSLLITINLFLVDAQFAFNSQGDWSSNKKELLFGFGATQFTGDLGGTSNIGKDYSLKDINLQSTGLSGLFGFRYRFLPWFATTTSLSIFGLKGNDSYSSNQIRNSRNLNFKATTFEFQQRFEYIFYSVEQDGAKYRLPVKHYTKNRNEQYYVFSGIGIININPKGFYNGQWHHLQPLRTEGQGYTGGPEAYKPYTLIIPFGIGFRVGINRLWRIGLEASYVKTFSDYIDDVSGVYFDPAKLDSDLASHFSNPANQNAHWFGPGEQRGDPSNKDAYYHLNIILTRNITYEGFRANLKIKKKKGTYLKKLKRFNG